MAQESGQPPAPPAQPQIVGRYAIYGEISSGGMASVHFGRLIGPLGFTRLVAIKRPHPHLVREPEFSLMFIDEARLAARIRHPNVVSTIDVLQTPTELLLVMEYVHGESLGRLASAAEARGERVPVPIAARIMVDVLHGLHAAHETTDDPGKPLGIVHRDVSPQNILVGVDGTARVIDFGIAKADERLRTTKDNSVKGKYAYMALEQLLGKPVSGRSDIYAAGIVFWELLTGKRLFSGSTDAETIQRCLEARIPPPSSLVPTLAGGLDAIVKKALAREPAWRYRSAREMALDIESCVPAVHPSAIGAWVVGLAGESLAHRAAEVAEIEHGQTPDALIAGQAALPADLSATAASAARVRVEPSHPSARPQPLPAVSPPRPSREGDSQSLVAGERVRSTSVWSRRKGLWLGSATVVVLGAVASISLILVGRSAGRREQPAGVPSAPPAASASLAAVFDARPDRTEGVDTTAEPDSQRPAPTVAPAAPAAATSNPRPPSPAKVIRTRRSSRCNPPFSIDAQGRQIFKPECL